MQKYILVFFIIGHIISLYFACKAAEFGYSIMTMDPPNRIKNEIPPYITQTVSGGAKTFRTALLLSISFALTVTMGILPSTREYWDDGRFIKTQAAIQIITIVLYFIAMVYACAQWWPVANALFNMDKVPDVKSWSEADWKVEHETERFRVVHQIYKLYEFNDYIAYLVDFFQRLYECCGVYDMTDWKLVRRDLPASCCLPKTEDCERDVDVIKNDVMNLGKNYAFGKRCGDTFNAWFKDKFHTIKFWVVVGTICLVVGWCMVIWVTWDYYDTTNLLMNFDFRKFFRWLCQCFTVQLDKDEHIDGRFNV